MPLQIVKPKIRGFICTNAHPIGCRKNVIDGIEIVQKKFANIEKKSDLNALVIGSSTGYGLASRIALTWGLGANTIGVFYERPPDGDRAASAGYYNTVAFHDLALRDQHTAFHINGDAFSDEIKKKTLDLIRENFGKIDILVYSLAAPRRTNPRTNTEHRSILRPVGKPYVGKTIDLNGEKITEVSINQATEKEIADTIAVMGGEDLEFWVDDLLESDLLAEGAKVVAYSYIGHEIGHQIYHFGTIGCAKEDLANRVNAIDSELSNLISGNAYVSVNKAVITQASAAIPVMPLYIGVLYKVMNEKGINEKPIHQMARLFSEQIGPDLTPTLDKLRQIRLDDRELRSDVSATVVENWKKINTENFRDLSDYDGYKRGFRNLFGFEVDGVDYSAEVETDLTIPLA